MVIYYKCSFRASHGFRIGKYDLHTDTLSFVSEKSNEKSVSLPKTIEYTLSHQLERCMLLATDENGYSFLGIYGLSDGNYDKYVNVVFYDQNNPHNIFALYDYLCSNQKSTMNLILKSIQRASEEIYIKTNLEFTVQKETVKKLISNAVSSQKHYPIKKFPPNFANAFITTDEYDNCQFTIEEKFSTSKMFLCDNFNIDSNIVPNYTKAFTKNKRCLLSSLLSSLKCIIRKHPLICAIIGLGAIFAIFWYWFINQIID